MTRLECLRRSVGEKSVDLGWRRRQAGQVVGGAANKGPAIRERHRPEFVVVELTPDEAIDVAVGPGGIAYLRRVWDMHRPERPEVAGVSQVEPFRGERCVAARVRRPHRNPCFQVADRRGRQFLFWRHTQVVVVVAHRLEEQAVGRLARNDRCSQAATLSQRHTRIDAQAALRFLGGRAVAGVTMLDQQRANPHLEENDPVRLLVGGGNAARRAGQESDYHQNPRPEPQGCC